MKLQPIRTLRPFEDAVRQIGDAIRSGDLRVGERLPSERTLAAELDISRPTLREALRVLTERDVLTVGSEGRSGIFVASDSIPVELDMETEPLSYARISDLLEFRRMLEPRVAQLAGFRATEADFSALEDALDNLRASRAQRGRFMLEDERFQLRIGRATHNDVVIGVFTKLFRELGSVRDLALRDDTEAATEWSIRSLTALLGAIMSRDPDRISEQVEDHLAYLETVWRKRTGRGVSRGIPEFLLARDGRAGMAPSSGGIPGRSPSESTLDGRVASA